MTRRGTKVKACFFQDKRAIGIHMLRGRCANCSIICSLPVHAVKRDNLESRCIEGDLTKYPIIWSLPAHAENAWATICQLVKYPAPPRCPLPNSGSPVSAFCIFLMWETFSLRRENEEAQHPDVRLIHLPSDWP